MYTVVFYNDETMEVVDTQESETIPNIGGAKWPYYIQEGAFDGVVDPSKALDTRSELEILREENEDLKEKNKMNAMAIMELTDMVLGG